MAATTRQRRSPQVNPGSGCGGRVGTVQRGRPAMAVSAAASHWRLERLRSDVNYFLQADGSGWEERWKGTQRLAVGGQIDRARESAEKLIQEEGGRRLGKKALRIARQAQNEITRIDSGVRDKRFTPRAGEAQTHEVLATLRGRADRFRDRHKGRLPTTTTRGTEWFMPVLVSAWAGAHLANSTRNSDHQPQHSPDLRQHRRVQWRLLRVLNPGGTVKA